MLSALLSLAFQSGTAEPAAHQLDSFMRDVTEACLLPDLEKFDPRQYLVAKGWAQTKKSGDFKKRIANANYSVQVKRPANKKSPASCSFETDQIASFDVYDWFRKRIGEPQDIRWTTAQIGGWRMTTNGHDVGVYVSRKIFESTGRVGMNLHILQH